MIEDFFPVYLAFGFHTMLLFFCGRVMRPLVGVLWITSLYYSILGPYYWVVFRNGFFLGVNWSDELPRAAIYIAYSALGFAVGAASLNVVWRFFDSEKNNFQFKNASSRQTNFDWQQSITLWRVTFFVGALGAFYVLAYIAGGGEDLNATDKFVLIAYQFSDLLIPAILFSIAARGLDRTNISLLAIFTFYASVVGFRYKLVLIYFPLGVMYLLPVSGKRKISRLAGLLMLVLVVAGFSVMTLTRSKFSGFDFSAMSSTSFDDALYGIFAESNIVFGLIGALIEAIDRGAYIYFTPISDAFLELIPRFLMPDRVTGGYQNFGLQNLIAEEALKSGTAFPYLGELLLMGGNVALVIGTSILCAIYVSIARLFARCSIWLPDIGNVGHGLIAAYFGYYYFSRGYFPQTFKAFLFVILPYVVMTARAPQLRQKKFESKLEKV